jgi:hypothetical protein
MYSMIGTAKLNGTDPQAWLADIIARLSDLPVSKLPDLLPWNWKTAKTQVNTNRLRSSAQDYEFITVTDAPQRSRRKETFGSARQMSLR